MSEQKDRIRWFIENAPNINKSLKYLIEELDELEKAFDELDSAFIDLEKENKRYREVLEKITQYGDVFSWQASQARKALEESE